MKLLNTYVTRRKAVGKRAWEEGNWIYFQVDNLVRVYEIQEHQRRSVLPLLIEYCSDGGIPFKQFRGPGC